MLCCKETRGSRQTKLIVVLLHSFIDRVNIGNAKVAGLATGLHLQGTEYNGQPTIWNRENPLQYG